MPSTVPTNPPHLVAGGAAVFLREQRDLPHPSPARATVGERSVTCPEKHISIRNEAEGGTEAGPAPAKKPTSYQRKQRDSMQENIESLCKQFGIGHCFEFTVTARRQEPEEFSKKLNSALTNYLREIFSHRIGVIEPHKSGHAHAHFLVVVPFQSPGFDHEAQAKSRELFKQKRFAESKLQWKKAVDSMSEEHRKLFYELREQLPKYGLGGMIGFSPVREGARAIACYFGKYLAKGIEQRRDDWKNVRLVRYSGTNAELPPAWKKSSPLRSGNSKWHQNHRDKLFALASSMGLPYGMTFDSILGARWHFHAQALVESIQLDVYRSILHAEQDGVSTTWPLGSWPHTFPHPDNSEITCVEFPDWAERDLYWPTEKAIERRTADEVAAALLEVAARTQPDAVSWWNGFHARRTQERVAA